ncbi:MAG: pentapeptide repeat-containing protein [Candidatus Aquirickettsiella sp.]
MPRDKLLSEKFFSTLDVDSELSASFKKEKDEIARLIKSKLYPAVQEGAVYYLEKHNNRPALNDFIQSENYSILQSQLQLIIKRLKTWGEQYQLEANNSLDDFLIKLKNPNEKITLLYADGKRSLETLTILLEDPQIDLELRKTVYIELLADNELSKCIDGCYTRIVSSAQQLQTYRSSPNQVNRWIRAYTTDIAKKVAGQRPFAMPESFQILVCRTLDIQVEANELHASNYLLSQAKEEGYPVAVVNDIGALEIAHKIKTARKNKIAELYIDDLAATVTATGLVHAIAMRLHAEFSQILVDPSKEYFEKITAIETKLGLIGSDPGFLLEEILDAELFTLKTVDSLKITTERRLSERNWFKSIQPGKLNISFKLYSYYNFPDNIELNWFIKEGESTRYRFFDLINDIDLELSTDLKFQLLMSLLRTPHYINSANNLQILLEKNSFTGLLANIIPTQRIVEILKSNGDALLFVNILKKLDQDKGSEVIAKLGRPFISNIIFEGNFKANIDRHFFWLEENYFQDRYNSLALTEGLLVTQHLFQQIIKKGYRDFERFRFYRLKYINYLDHIDFSYCQLGQAFFFQKVSDCTFDHASLKGALFDARLAFSSFRGVDLRKTRFMPPIYYPYYKLNLNAALLSTESFRQLLSAGIDIFSGSDLTEVDFQVILHRKSLKLDFSGVNLENNNLKELDFSQIKLYGSNLRNTNLVYSLFSHTHLDENVIIEGAELTRFAAFTDFLKAGISNFDHCKIIEFDTSSPININPSLQLKRISFKEAEFLGKFHDIDFRSCDLRHAKFTHLPYTTQPGLLYNIIFHDCRLENSEFHHIKFVEPFKLQICTLRNVKLENIEMSASVLFKFYASGQRNFNGVSALKGKIPDKLPPMPLLEARLSKEVFIRLYRLGLRDFRSSNLYGFILSEILEKEAIQVIDLKLEGADYQQSTLSCASTSHSSKHAKRSLSLLPMPSSCKFYVIIQKAMLKKTVSWQDLLEEPVDDNKNEFFKEVALGPKPLYFLENPDILNFYWGYNPNNEALIKAVVFLSQSTQLMQRETIQLNFYFTTTQTEDTVKNFAQILYQLGFRKGQLIYPTKKNQLTALDLTTHTVSLSYPKKLQDRLLSINKKLAIAPTLAKNTQPNIQHTIATIKTRLQGSVRYSLKQGMQYDLALVLMDLISVWLYQANTPEAKQLDVTTKLALQEFASQTVDREAVNHRANDHQQSLTFRIALQCIERGECSTPELVEANIMDTLQTLKPDVQIGFEVMWEKIKYAFDNLGRYISDKFNEIEKSFKLIVLVYEMSERANKANTHKVKRKIYDWYNRPQLIHFIKHIEIAFIELGYDLNLDPNFSESLLAGYLYDLWSALAKQGVSSQTSPQNILQLLENEPFRQSTFDGTYLNNTKTFYPLGEWSKTELNSTTQDLMNKTIINSTSLPINSSTSNNKTRKKRSMLIPASTFSLKSSATRSLGFINTMAHYVTDSFYTLKARIPISDAMPNRQKNKTHSFCWQPPIKANNIQYLIPGITSEVPLPNTHVLSPLPYTLDTFNNILLLVNYVLKLFFKAKNSKQDEKNSVSAQKARKKMIFKKQRRYYPSQFILFKSILDEHADDLIEKNQCTFKV